MAYKEINSVGTYNFVTLGGYNKKTRLDNPVELEGYLIGSEEIVNQFDKAKMKTRFIFKTKDGNLAIDAPHDLKVKLSKATVGRMTLVQFTGEKDVGKGNPMKEFKVAQDATNVLDEDTIAEIAKYSAPQVEDDEPTEAEQPEEVSYASKRSAPAPKAHVSPSDQARVAALLKRTS